MKTHIVIIAIILSFFACNTGNKQKDKQSEMSSSTATHLNDPNSCVFNNSLVNLTVNELNAINRNITARARENFRSWNYKEPERWDYLSDKFANEVIKSNPDATSKKEEISKVFLTHLNQRADIYNSNVKNKQALMGRSSEEFKYNLSFLIGIEGYRKWQSLSNNELQKFNLVRDSLNEVIAFTYTKIQKTKMMNP